MAYFGIVCKESLKCLFNLSSEEVEGLQNASEISLPYEMAKYPAKTQNLVDAVDPSLDRCTDCVSLTRYGLNRRIDAMNILVRKRIRKKCDDKSKKIWIENFGDMSCEMMNPNFKFLLEIRYGTGTILIDTGHL